MMSESHDLVKNGESFKIGGWYQYAGHVHDDDHDDAAPCHIPNVAYCMVFQEGDKAPILPSCSHDIRWKLLYPY